MSSSTAQRPRLQGGGYVDNDHPASGLRADRTGDDRASVRALLAGDEATFVELTGRHHPDMVRLARCYVGDREAAEQLATQAWLTALRSLDRWDGTPLKLWLFKILIDIAERSDCRRPPEPGEDPNPALPVAGNGRRSEQTSRAWGPRASERLATPESRAVVERALTALPEPQRRAITLRDVAGWPADDVCRVLAISDRGLRSLLHRARMAVHAALDVQMASVAA